MNVAFVNDNILGHVSYLSRFVRALQEEPELGVRPFVINTHPMPPTLHRLARTRLQGLARFGLDLAEARLRLVASYHARRKLDELLKHQVIDAVVVNPQFAGLHLTDLAVSLPLLVSTDATLIQSARADGWFGHDARKRRFLPLTLAPIRGAEHRLYQSAVRLLPWADYVKRSLVQDYRFAAERISVLPPSMRLPERHERPRNRLPRLLFVGGDFRRKGGPILLKCFQDRFRGRCEMDVVTFVDVPVVDGVRVHTGIVADSPEWFDLWRRADVFVLPSVLDLVPSVLMEALAFGVPVISSDVGAAREILADGQAGVLLPSVDEDALAIAIEGVLADPAGADRRSELGRRHAEARFDVSKNAARLANMLHSSR